MWVLRKLGFTKVIIFSAGEERIYEYQNRELGDAYVSSRMSLDKQNSDNYIQFWGDKKRFSQRRFDLNCEIAFESWVLATRKWKELNQADFKFSGEALEQKNSPIEKARDLYLP